MFLSNPNCRLTPVIFHSGQPQMKSKFLAIPIISSIILAYACVPASPTTTPIASITLQTSPTEELSQNTITPIEDPYAKAHQQMVDIIISRGVQNQDVIQAMLSVPRHEFVPDDYDSHAYADHPLPIGYGQTISQPYIVALMTELLELKTDEKVLEIGTGSGYQAAVLAELGFVEVYSIEIVPELAERASQTLELNGYDSVKLKHDDGYYGWEEYAPFDAIIVTAAPDHLPIPLAQQLADGGRLVIPIGPPGGFSTLWKFIKSGEEMKAINVLGVKFVPFTGEGVSSHEDPVLVPQPTQ
jgi:protein-L-isoaspartate(D-aspartate) O-methyltransferase